MMLSDARDYIESLDLAEHVYMGKMPDKQDKSIGVYNSKHAHTYQTAIGGPMLESYGTKYVTFWYTGINPQEILKRPLQPYLRPSSGRGKQQ